MSTGLVSKTLAVTCDCTVSSTLSSHFPATSNVEQVAYPGEMLNNQLWSSWGKSTYCYTQDQSYELTLPTQLTAGGWYYKEGNSTQLRNVATAAQSGRLEYFGQCRGAKQ